MADLSARANFDITATDLTAKAFEGISSNLDRLQNSALSVAKGGLAALAAGLTVGVFTKFMDGVIESAASIQKLHEMTGLGVDALTTLRSAAKLAGTDFDSITPAILKLEQNMVKAAGGSDEMSNAFKALGIDVEEASGALRTPDAVMLELAKRFEDMEDGAGKTGLAMQLFGKKGAEMIPILHELALQGEYVTKITKLQAEAADDYQKNLVKIEGASNAAKNAVGNALIPAFDAVSQVMLQTLTGAGGLRAKIMELVSDGSIASWAQTGVIWLARIADIVANMGGLFGALISTVVDVAKAFMQFDNVLGGVQKMLTGDMAGGLAQVKQGWEGMKDVGSKIATTWADATTRTTKFEDAAISAVLRVSEMGNGAEKTGHQVTNFGAAHKQAADDVQKLVDKLEQERQSLAYQVDAMERYGVAAKASKEQQVELAIQQGAYNTKLKDGSTIFDEHAQKLAANATAEAKQIDILTAVKAIHEEYFKTVEKYNEGLSKSVLEIYKSIDAENLKKASLEGGAAAAVNYRIAEEQRYQQTAELSQAEIAASNARVTALEKLRGALADTGALQDAIKYQQQHTAELGKSVDAIDREVEVVARSTDTFGLSKLALIDYRIAQEQLKLGVMELSAEETKAIELRIAGLEKLKGEVQMHDALEQSFSEWKSFWTNIADAGSSFIVDFVEHGSSAFKNLWDNFKHWALEALAKIAAQQIVVSLGASVGGVASTAANAAAGGAGGNLLGLASNANSAYNLFSGGGALGGITSAFSAGYAGASSAAITYGAGAAAEVGAAAAGTMEAGGIIAGLEAGLAAVPVVGWVALAAVIVAGILGGMDDGPAMRSASFGSNGGLGAGNPLFRSSSNLGTFGIFNDSWFSDKDQGEAVQKFLAGIQTIDNAIANMVDAPTLERIKANLATATTTFEAGMEHEATQFGSILQQRYHTVVEAIDPELTHLVDQFQGTGEELGKFVIGIVAVHETLKTFNQEDLFGQLVTVDDIIALEHAGESVTQTFSRVVNEFSLTNAIAAQMGQDVKTAFGGVGLASEGARAELIKLMGGMDHAAAAFQNYLQVAFTDTERQAKVAAAATSSLNAVFGDLHHSVPQTWAELNEYIASLDLSTEAGRAAYAAIMTEGVPAFVALHGTAQEAAAATNSQASANSNVASASNQAATAAKNVINPMMGVIEAFHQLRSAADIANEHLGHTTDQNDAVLGFTGGSNEAKLTNKLRLISGEIADLEAELARYQPGGDLATTDNAFGNVATLLKEIAPLKGAQSIVADALAHFATLQAQYGADAAEQLYDLESRYNETRADLAGNNTALDILARDFQSKWDKIVGDAKDATTSVAASTQTLVEHVLTPLEAALNGLHSAFASDSVLTDAVKWLNGIDLGQRTVAASDDWQSNLNGVLPIGDKLFSNRDAAAMTRVIGQLLDDIRQGVTSGATATAVQQPGSRVTS
jgi:hypothetical protein